MLKGNWEMVLEETIAEVDEGNQMLAAALGRYQHRVIDAAMAINEDDDCLIAFFEGQIEHWEAAADGLAEPPLGYAAAHAAKIVAMLEGAVQACRKPSLTACRG